MGKDDEKDTHALVYQAAEKMLKAGRAREISVRSISEIIRYGSATTINNALNGWWTELGERLAEYEQLPGIPEPLQAQVVELLTTVQRSAAETARQRLVEYERQAELRIETMQTKLDAEITAKATAEQRAQGLVERIDTLDTRIHGLESLLAAEQARREAAEQRVQEARGDAEQARRDAQAQIQELKHQQALEQERFAALEQRLVMQIDEHKTARQQLEKLRQENEREWREKERGLHERLSAVEHAKRLLESDMATQRRERDALKTDKEHLVERLQQIEVTLNETRAVLEQERLRSRELQVSLTASEQSRVEQEQRSQRLEERLMAVAEHGRGKRKR